MLGRRAFALQPKELFIHRQLMVAGDMHKKPKKGKPFGDALCAERAPSAQVRILLTYKYFKTKNSIC